MRLHFWIAAAHACHGLQPPIIHPATQQLRGLCHRGVEPPTRTAAMRAGLKSRSCQQLPGVVLASLCGACSSLVLPRLTREPSTHRHLGPRLHWLHSRGTSRWSRVHRAPKVVTRSVLANRYCGRYWHRVGPPVHRGCSYLHNQQALRGVRWPCRRRCRIHHCGCHRSDRLCEPSR